MFRIFCSLLLFLSTTCISFSNTGKILLNPPVHIIDLDKGKRVYNYELSNLGDADVAIEVELSNWTKDNTNNMLLVPPTAGSLDQWIIASPLTFTVPAEGSQVVRFSIRPAVTLAEGEHRAVFIFRQKDLGAKKNNTDSRSLVVRNLFEIKSAVYATAGEVIRSGEILKCELTTNSLRTRIQSSGNGHVRPSGRFQVWESSAFPGKAEALQIDLKASDENPLGMLYEGRLRGASVLNGQTQWVNHRLNSLNLDTGSYIVLIHGRLGTSPLEIIEPFTLAP